MSSRDNTTDQEFIDKITEWAWAALGSRTERLTKREFFEQFPKTVEKGLKLLNAVESHPAPRPRRPTWKSTTITRTVISMDEIERQFAIYKHKDSDNKIYSDNKCQSHMERDYSKAVKIYGGSSPTIAMGAMLHHSEKLQEGETLEILVRKKPEGAR